MLNPASPLPPPSVEEEKARTKNGARAAKRADVLIDNNALMTKVLLRFASLLLPYGMIACTRILLYEMLLYL